MAPAAVTILGRWDSQEVGRPRPLGGPGRGRKSPAQSRSTDTQRTELARTRGAPLQHGAAASDGARRHITATIASG